MKNRSGNILKSMDIWLVLIYTILVFMGWINIYSAVYDESHSSIFSTSQRYGKQLIWIGIAYAGIIVPIMVSSNKIYSVLSYLIYFAIIGILAMVLVFGKETNGAKSWFEITESFKIQPSEFAKFATALALSRFMSDYEFDINKPRSLFLSIAIIGVPAMLILLQPDMGSVLVYCSLIFVFYREGLPGIFLWMVAYFAILFVYALQVNLAWVMLGTLVVACGYYLYMGRPMKEMLVGIGSVIAWFAIFFVVNKFILHDKFEIQWLIVAAFILSTPIFLYYAYHKKIQWLTWLCAFVIVSFIGVFSVNFIFNNVMTAHQRTLINVFLGTEVDPKGTGYNVEQSKIAIGSGGLTGKGLLQGTQTKYNFVPEQATDFIFCTVGEEWGFVGTTVVIALFVALILRIMYLAELQRSSFSRIYGYCVASILFLHLAINVGMTIGMVPVIGIPLPFFSYGGSSLWSFTVLLFIFIRLDASRDELM